MFVLLFWNNDHKQKFTLTYIPTRSYIRSCQKSGAEFQAPFKELSK
ncbi:unnamed protein product [Brassica rapa subsp. narinosa]